VSSQQPAGDPATRRRICEAALRLITKKGGVDVTLGEVAKAAKVSRQALYLHFDDRAALFVATVQYADEQRGIPEAVQRLREMPTALDALRELTAMQARLNPGIWPLARMLDGVRRQNDAAERSWQDRLSGRHRGCRAVVDRLKSDGVLRPGLDPDVATDLLWTMTSLRAWEDLVLLRGWAPEEYQTRLLDALTRLLVRPGASASHGRDGD
jgi:AcrR family transcriptional regulator